MKGYSHGQRKNRASSLIYSKILPYLAGRRPDTFDLDKIPVELDAEAKVSNAVLELVEPVLESITDLESVASVLMIAVEIWNLLALPEPERKNFLVFLVNSFKLERETRETRESFWADVDTLIDRRENLFGVDRRPILLFKLYQEGQELRFRVEGLGSPDALI